MPAARCPPASRAQRIIAGSRLIPLSLALIYTAAEHIKQSIATIGENIQVRRFERFVLGEGVEKKVVDFAAEVAAQTGGKV